MLCGGGGDLAVVVHNPLHTSRPIPPLHSLQKMSFTGGFESAHVLSEMRFGLPSSEPWHSEAAGPFTEFGGGTTSGPATTCVRVRGGVATTTTSTTQSSPISSPTTSDDVVLLLHFSGEWLDAVSAKSRAVELLRRVEDQSQPLWRSALGSLTRWLRKARKKCRGCCEC